MTPIEVIPYSRSETTRPTLENMDVFVVSLCSGSFVRVHPWFSIGGAREVARFKNARHVLVVGNQTVMGLVDGDTLARAPGNDVVTRWVRQTTLKVVPETGWQEALRLMRAAHSDWLLVASEKNFVVGVVMRAALEAMDARNI